MSQDCKMPEYSDLSILEILQYHGSQQIRLSLQAACDNDQKSVQSKISCDILCETAYKALPHPHPNTTLKCGCHNTSVVYCSRAQFSIDLLYIIIWGSWIKMAWFQLGSLDIIVEIIIARVWFQPAIVFMSQWRYTYAFGSHFCRNLPCVHFFMSKMPVTRQERQWAALHVIIKKGRKVLFQWRHSAACRSITFKLHILQEYWGICVQLESVFNNIPTECVKKHQTQSECGLTCNQILH